MLMHIKCRD